MCSHVNSLLGILKGRSPDPWRKVKGGRVSILKILPRVFFSILRGEQSFTAAGLAPKRTIQTAAELEADRQGTTG